MRLFVSIDLPGEVQEKLQYWLPSLPELRYTKKEQLHLTLLFLGESDEGEANLIAKRLGAIQFEPFDMVIEGVGAFPSRTNPRVFWAGVKKNIELIRLQKQISEKLSGFVDDGGNDSFKPHITLARATKQFRLKRSEKLFEKEESIFLKVASVSLKKSILSEEGSTHTVLKTFYADRKHS